MQRTIRVTTIFFFGIAALLCFARPASAAALSPASVIAAINHERASAALPDLHTDQRLMQAAKNKLNDMAAQHYFDHASPTGDMPWDFFDAAGYTYRASGENLARDYFSISSLINSWMNSDTHRDNLLSLVFQDIGVAIGPADGHTVVVALFGSTDVKPLVAGVETQDTTVSEPTNLVPTIIPNNPQALNNEVSGQKVIHTQSLATLPFLIFSIIAAATVLALGIKAG